jgi:endonuclease III
MSVKKTKTTKQQGAVTAVKAPPKKGKVKKTSTAVAGEVMERLCARYPDADCELTYKNAFELLISVILSAQTTDVNVNKATPGLFKHFPTAKALAEAPIEKVKELIRSTGYYNAKAANIQACARGLVERFQGSVPDNLEDLTTLPGVGRKTANVVLGVIFKQPGWTVDTHVQRLTQRLGFTSETDPAKIERDLQKLFPDQDWTQFSITLIWHGRRCCYARKPDCGQCPVNQLCPNSEV